MTNICQNNVVDFEYKIKQRCTMKTKVYCKLAAKGQQAFYLVVENKEYYLFSQDYRSSVKEYFMSGISIRETTNFANAHSAAVRRTLDKLKTYIPYIEKEYGIVVMDKTRKRQDKKRTKPYRRQSFNWKTVDWEYAY